MSLIECVPNVSEGRRAPIVEAMAEAVRRAEGVRLLDVSSDPSHNRSVLTFVGDPPALERAVLALATSAVGAIDLTAHGGEHPRLGAADVVPFIPLDGATMADCVGLARRVGRAIADRLHVPVYLYEEAASRPERRHLEDIRRGGLEGLARRMADEAWRPDFGPSAPHPTAGTTIVGARRPLIAFNVNLATDRLEVAKAIARKVRQRDGGLTAVKALGMTLDDRGIVQVSMNLTNYEATSIARAFDAVQKEAALLGITVADSEIIGLVPRAALSGTTPEHLRLRDFGPDRILENRLL